MEENKEKTSEDKTPSAFKDIVDGRMALLDSERAFAELIIAVDSAGTYGVKGAQKILYSFYAKDRKLQERRVKLLKDATEKLREIYPYKSVLNANKGLQAEKALRGTKQLKMPDCAKIIAKTKARK